MKKKVMKWAAVITAAMMSLTAQAKTQDVSGRVIDMKGEPLAFVSVSLLSEDSVYIEGATSNEEGRFLIQTPAADGILRLSYLGYKTKYVDVRGMDIGTIQMEEDQAMLQEITIKGQMPKTKLTGNSMGTTIQGTVLGQSGTANEMLAKVPGMIAKGEELEVLGKGTPIYYINGRKMHDKDELKRLRSEEILSVEVITNPGAQYDATISAVVRIKTIRHEGDGFGFDIATNTNQDLTFGYFDPNATLNLRYRHNSLDFFGMVNWWKWDQTNIFKDSMSTCLLTDAGVKNILQNSDVRQHWQGNGINYNLGFNWQISDKHSLGAKVERHDSYDSGNHLASKTVLEHRFQEVPAFMNEEVETKNDEQRHTPYSWQANAYYNGQVGKLNIDLNMDFLTNKLNEANNITEYRTITNQTKEQSTTTKSTSNMEQDEHSSSRLWAAKLVLTYPVWKGQLQAGTEMSFARRSSSSLMTDFLLPASDTEVKENNMAAFVSYHANLQKWGTINAGLRYEHVGFDYTDNLDASRSMTRYQDEFFPNLSWARQFGPFQTSLAYSIKTIRPNYDQLSDHIVYVNSYTLIQGDPKQKNAIMQEMSLNARWKWLNLFAAYERRDNTLSQLPQPYKDQGVMLMKRVNLEDPVRNLAVFLSANPTWGVYSPNWTIGGQKFWNTMEFDDPRSKTGKTSVTYTKPIFFFDIHNTFRFKHSWQLEANMSIQTKGDVINFRMTSVSNMLGFVVQKSWLKNDALCLRASVSDVFQRSVQDMVMDCGFYRAEEATHRSNHRFNISIRYTFNASKSKYKGTGAGRAELERMGSSS
ncbi:MAG: outer membrane beta-barrel protein [Prevotella sp.]|nr:outer membrane beta-barrel protein [Prevotella sp.]